MGKTFTSENGWFTITLPSDWEEYDDEDTDSDTYAFFNMKSWTGNLRITPFKNFENPEKDMAADFMDSELEENESAISMKLGELDAIHYKEEIEGDLIIYYWITGKNDTLFTCSFTTNKQIEGSKENGKELELVQKILSTIKIN